MKITRELNLINAQIALVLLGIYWVVFFLARRWVAHSFPEALQSVSLGAIMSLGLATLFGIGSVLTSQLGMMKKVALIVAVTLIAIVCYMIPYSIFPSNGSNTIADLWAFTGGVLLIVAGVFWASGTARL